MHFKENLKRKIRIDRLTRRVLNSMGPVDSDRRIDKPAMRKLLEMADYQSRTERDMEIYSPDFNTSPAEILVLDNELPIYRTTFEDVLLRKNPTTREMISIRNIIKILNDKDIVVEKRHDAALRIRQELVSELDLSYTAADIESIEADGVNALSSGEPDGVTQALELFSELTGLRMPPLSLDMPGIFILGDYREGDTEAPFFGSPMIVCNRHENTLQLFESGIRGAGIREKDAYREFFDGTVKPELEGQSVFDWLKKRVADQMDGERSTHHDRMPDPI